MDTTRRLRMLVGALAAATVGLVGCGSGDDDSATEAPTKATPDTTAESEPEPELDLTGLAVVDSDGELYEAPRLEFVDPSTGEVRTTVDYAGTSWDPGDDEVRSRRSYSADWRHLAMTMESEDADEVRVMRLNEDGTAYEELFGIGGSDEGSYSAEPTEYRNPRFAPDGVTLWMEMGPVGGPELTLVSVDVESYEEGDEPEPSEVRFAFDEAYDSPDGDPVRDAWTLDGTGRPALMLRDEMRETSGGDGARALYWTDAGGTVVGASFTGDCRQVAQLDDGAFLLATCGDSALARGVLDPQAGTLQLTELVPEGVGGMPETTVVSPDATEALLRIEDVWYLASLATPGAEPQPVDGLDLDFRGPDANAGVALLGWS